MNDSFLVREMDSPCQHFQVFGRLFGLIRRPGELVKALAVHELSGNKPVAVQLAKREKLGDVGMTQLRCPLGAQTGGLSLRSWRSFGPGTDFQNGRLVQGQMAGSIFDGWARRAERLENLETRA